MNLLRGLAEPAFAKDAPIRLNARALGFVVFGWSALYLLGVPFDVLMGGSRLGAVGKILFITPLPQLLALPGGVRMWQGDAKGKRLVVLSLAAGFVWSTLLRLGELGPAFGEVVVGVPVDLVIAAFLYYVVATSEFRGNARLRDVLSVAALLVGCVAIVVLAVFGLAT